MASILLLSVCLLIGFLLRRLKILPTEASRILNTVVLYVPLPALALVTIPFIDWDFSLALLMLAPWLIFFLAYIFFTSLGQRWGWDRGVVGCLILTAGLGNTAFVGFPIIEALFGKEGLKYAVLLDQPGTFLIASSLGIWVAALFSHGKLPKRELAWRVLTFPFTIAFALALLLAFLGWSPRGMVLEVLSRLAGILTPLALISVGLQLEWREVRQEGKYLCWGLGFKLFLAPLIIAAVYSLLAPPRLVFEVSVMEAAMAPMITASLLAASHNLSPRLAGMMVGVGVPLSFITLSLWYLLLTVF